MVPANEGWSRSGWGVARTIVLAILATLAVCAFHDAASGYDGYTLPAYGVRELPLPETAFLLWHAFWCTLAVGLLAAALGGTSLPERLYGWATSTARDPRRTVVGGMALVFVVSVMIRHGVLLDLPVTDDEHVYTFIAQTLMEGRVDNPLPPDAFYFDHPFIVFTEDGWHGKYPIGHPLLLVPFLLLRRLDLLGPTLAAVSFGFSFAVGRRMFGPRRATLGAALLALSPHFLFTHATLLSQVTSGVMLLVALWGALQLTDHGGRRAALVTGFGLGFGLMVRPMPGLLFAGTIGLTVLLSGRVRRLRGRRSTWAELGIVAILVGLGAAVLLITHQIQAGDPLRSAYLNAHGTYGAFQNIEGELSNSVGGALARENAWLLGWPGALLLALFARPRQGAPLFVGCLVSVLAYRLIVPKTVVATTGPVYLAEVVPLLTAGVADGAARLARKLDHLGRGWGRRYVTSALIAGTIVAGAAFLPYAIRSVQEGAAARLRTIERLDQAGAYRNTLVFCNSLARPEPPLTWVHWPPVPTPTLDAPRLYLRYSIAADGRERAWTFWREHFPERHAFFWGPRADGRWILEQWNRHTPPEGWVTPVPRVPR